MKRRNYLLGMALGLASIGSATSAFAAGAALGVTMSDNLNGGAVVTGVYPGSPAATAGLRIGDRIVSIDGRNVANYRDVIGTLAASEPNAVVDIGVNRLGWQRTLPATLAAPGTAFQSQPITALTPPAIPPVRVQSTEEPTWTPADIDDQHGYGSS